MIARRRADQADEFDYVIVGSGSGGALLANRLITNTSSTVCVLEAGGMDYHPYIHIPAGFIKALNSKTLMWQYETAASDSVAGRSIGIPQGKVLGGSSSVNGLIYNRGQPADFDEWASRGNAGWSYGDILPYFKRTETWLGSPKSRLRGSSGPLFVSTQDWRLHLSDVYYEAAKEIGIPELADYNADEIAGVGYYQRTAKGNRRASAATAFLHPIRSHKNLSLRTNAEARRILFDGKRATGIEYVRPDGGTVAVRARKQVVLSAGTIGTARLLQLNGIGAPDVLKSADVEVFHDLPGVGGNFRDHYATRIVSKVRNTRTINEIAVAPNLWWEVAKWLLKRQSVLNLGPSLIHVLWKSRDSLNRPDLQCSFMPGSYRMGHLGALDNFPGMTCGIFQQRPKSRGFVHIQSPDPRAMPLIQPNYLTEAEDCDAVVGGLKLVRRLMATEALAPYNAGEFFPGPDVRTDDDLLAFARRSGGTAYHLIGTASMGPAGDPKAVVSDRLEVHGLQGLRVVDASVMPSMPSGNVNAPTLMIAEKAAAMMGAAS
jgi:choline dehydrogenase